VTRLPGKCGAEDEVNKESFFRRIQWKNVLPVLGLRAVWGI